MPLISSNRPLRDQPSSSLSTAESSLTVGLPNRSVDAELAQHGSAERLHGHHESWGFDGTLEQQWHRERTLWHTRFTSR